MSPGSSLHVTALDDVLHYIKALIGVKADVRTGHMLKECCPVCVTTFMHSQLAETAFLAATTSTGALAPEVCVSKLLTDLHFLVSNDV